VDDILSRRQADFVLITGSSSGIGRELAIQLSRSYRLILNGRDTDRLERTRESCTNPRDHYVWRYDLAEVDQLGEDLTSFLCRHGISVSSFVHCGA
jgi:short-subunit dehydrogenase